SAAWSAGPPPRASTCARPGRTWRAAGPGPRPAARPRRTARRRPRRRGGRHSPARPPPARRGRPPAAARPPPGARPAPRPARATGCELTAAERLPDDPARVAARVREALERSDAVLTIGGVSAGDFDPVKEALAAGVAPAAPGGVELWRVAMRPGRPQAFGMP